MLSGNRNFEGRINPYTRANYLASPPLVVAYALAGSVDKDLINEPLGKGRDGQEVFLRDVWPTLEEMQETIKSSLSPEMFKEQYGNVYEGNPEWNEIEVAESALFPWSDSFHLYPASRPSSRTCRRTRSRCRKFRARAAFCCSVTPSPPTTSRPRAPSRSTARRAAT